MQAVLDSILNRLIQVGRLTVYWPDGSSSVYEGAPGPTASMRLRSARVVRRLISNPSMAIGEGYMDGDVVPGEGGIYDLIDVAMTSLTANPHGHPAIRTRERLER